MSALDEHASPQKVTRQPQTTIDEVRNQVAGASATPREQATPTPIDEKKRKQKIDNDNAEKDQRLKTLTLVLLFAFLTLETIVIFVLAFFQGFGYNKFHLDEWSFKLVILATLGQITAMLTIAVTHLFPKKKN
ncbi:MAG TPA: hypothetical protein VK502_03925 [Candidatus Saccharimonadales bacterium]|jgi:hypothetical protein|nr:hypothetical protein [Candidatus Saccharimonadales bacterium]